MTIYSKQNKYRRLVNYMGGQCIDVLADVVTHLVTDSVKTKKYEVNRQMPCIRLFQIYSHTLFSLQNAVMNDIKIMKTSWIHDVWKHSCEENILATAEQFNCHKLPAFYNLNVTTTGLSKRDKTRIQALVSENGGKHFGEFSSNINIVIAKKNATETDKLKAALTSGKDCLQVEWIVDSAKRGCALPFDDYRIELQAKKTTSTPTKRTYSQMNSSSSSIELSHIQYSKVNETALSNVSTISDVSVMGGRTRKSNDAITVAPYKSILDNINIQEVKKAGTFLDGCCVCIHNRHILSMSN